MLRSERLQKSHIHQNRESLLPFDELILVDCNEYLLFFLIRKHYVCIILKL